MNLLVPAALAFSLIIPIILLLYFMRPKRQERVVGSTFLWQQALQDLQASRPWQRLRVTPLLILQLLAALFIVLILARPAIFINSPISGNTIIILQTSASMQATDVAPSRFESARNDINDYIDALGPSDHLSIITMARTPQVLAVQLQDKGQLHAALERAQVTNQDADLEQALSLAASLTAGQSNTQVLVIGDGHVLNNNQALATPFPVRYMSIGTDAPNVALLALSSRVVNNHLVAFAQIANYSHQQRAIPVELSTTTANSTSLLAVKTVSLSPGASGSLEWDNVPPRAQFLHARLVSQNAMMADHDAWALVGNAIHGRVLLVTKENGYLQTALRLQPNVDLFATTPDKYQAPPPTAYDLTIFDGFVPTTLPNGNIFFVDPPTGRYAFGQAGRSLTPTRVNAANDSLNMLTNVDLSTTHVHVSHQLTPASWAQTIVASPETPLLIAGTQNNKRIAVLGFDIHDADLALQPAFPILIHNMMSWFLPQPVAGDAQVSAGQAVTVQTWPGADTVTVTGPDKQTTTVGPPFPTQPYNKTNMVGVYTVSQRVHGGTLNGAFTVNLFDSAQSRLAPAHALPILHSTNIAPAGNTVSRQLREVWPWIAAVLLLILCAEWWLFSRSYRQQPAPLPRRSGSNNIPTTKRSRSAIFVASLQSQLQGHYRRAKKRTLKVSKRIKSKLRRQSKGARRVNI